nr:serine/arginine repetitive matrix protein 1-like [Manis javanica]
MRAKVLRVPHTANSGEYTDRGADLKHPRHGLQVSPGGTRPRSGHLPGRARCQRGRPRRSGGRGERRAASLAALRPIPPARRSLVPLRRCTLLTSDAEARDKAKNTKRSPLRPRRASQGQGILAAAPGRRLGRGEAQSRSLADAGKERGRAPAGRGVAPAGRCGVPGRGPQAGENDHGQGGRTAGAHAGARALHSPPAAARAAARRCWPVSPVPPAALPLPLPRHRRVPSLRSAKPRPRAVRRRGKRRRRVREEAPRGRARTLVPRCARPAACSSAETAAAASPPGRQASGAPSGRSSDRRGARCFPRGRVGGSLRQSKGDATDHPAPPPPPPPTRSGGNFPRRNPAALSATHLALARSS